LISVVAIADPDPCQQIQDICGEAGYTRELSGGKDLMTKCYWPTLQGQAVDGVKVDPDTVQKCNYALNPKTTKKHHRP